MTTRGRPWRRVPFRLAGFAIAAMLVVLLAAPAMASGYVDDAATALAKDPVYVNNAADPKPSAAQQDQLRQHINGSDVAIYIAILPEAALNQSGGSADSLLGQIAQALDRPGVYALLAGNHFRAGSTNGALPAGVAPRLATEAFDAKHSEGAQATLVDFVDRVKSAAAQGGGDATSSEGSRSGSGAGAVIGVALAVLAVVGGGALIFSSRRKRREQQRQFEQVKGTAQEDLVALGEDIRALDLDVEMPGVADDTQPPNDNSRGRSWHANLCVVRPAGFEPAALGLEVLCSIR